jgi:pyruvate formate lyase activating enzyme
MTVVELEEELLVDRMFFDESEGGVTFSGGEPLNQFRFLTAGLEVCRRHEIHTVVDTCGHALQQHLLDIAPLTDIFLYDLKHMDSGVHERVTGVPNKLILDNLTALGTVHDNIWIRIPVVPGINDSTQNMEAAAAFVSRIPGVRHVDLLPFHQTGSQKFVRAGKSYSMNGTPTPSRRQLNNLAACFTAHKLETHIGG